MKVKKRTAADSDGQTAADRAETVRPSRIQQPIPAGLEVVGMIDAKTAAAGGGASLSWWYAAVSAGRAPQPVVKGNRFTRWALADVRAFWAELAEKGVAA